MEGPFLEQIFEIQRKPLHNVVKPSLSSKFKYIFYCHIWRYINILEVVHLRPYLV